MEWAGRVGPLVIAVVSLVPACGVPDRANLALLT